MVISFAALAHLQEWVPFFVENFLAPSYQTAGLPEAITESVLAATDFVADPDLIAYHAYGLDRNTMQEVYGMKILRQYARWRAEGKPVKMPSEDPLQRGGDFVVGNTGRLTLAHTGRNQSERPAVADILAAIQTGSQAKH